MWRLRNIKIILDGFKISKNVFPSIEYKLNEVKKFAKDFGYYINLNEIMTQTIKH
ncbi:hypothetical protein HYD61_00840 [Mycoplasmopsis bovis]|nr:hypothetical protein HYD61_00840 [Mycoplasmopsis bovis]